MSMRLTRWLTSRATTREDPRGDAGPPASPLLADRAQAIGILLVCAGICRLAYMG